jgi:hypothetical protein
VPRFAGFKATEEYGVSVTGHSWPVGAAWISSSHFPFILHLFNIFLTDHDVPDTVPGLGNTAENKADVVGTTRCSEPGEVLRSPEKLPEWTACSH